MTDFASLLIQPSSSIREAIDCIEQSIAKIALVVDSEGCLLDTITDGDIRRAILAGVNLDDNVTALHGRKGTSSRYSEAITAPIGTDKADLLVIMKNQDVRHVPIVDNKKVVVDLVTLRELIADDELPIQAVVMAGGSGTRLRPLTENLPKPMVPVGGKPMLERIIEQLRDAGIPRVMVTTHYKSELISKHFGDGEGFGVDISYVEEDKPMGTAGGLSQLESLEEPILVINGDILTKMDFRAMLDFHNEHSAEMSVAVTQHKWQVPYGVIEMAGENIINVLEKPTVNHFINAGIYLLNPAVAKLIPNNAVYDMPQLINRLIEEKRKVISFPIREYWLDIGQHKDYERAEQDVLRGKA
tara:strand:- start:152 stop:1222 length:1071 start_codon:yes stop_codon:yes gene_type:complete